MNKLPICPDSHIPCDHPACLRSGYCAVMKPPETKSDSVNSPKHYTSHPAKCACGLPIECIQITEHQSFNIGNAMKYLWRVDLKGNALEDLGKARWYIEREIAKREKR